MIKTPVRYEAKLVFNDDHSDLERRLKIAEEALDDANSQLTGGWQYLMSVPADDITVEDALEAFGFGRHGQRWLRCLKMKQEN